MTAPAAQRPRSNADDRRIPPLESGDRLTRREFERRYEATPAKTKAELIEGVVYIASPVRIEQHAEPHLTLAGWLGAYSAQQSGVHGANNGTVRLDADNVVQPDVILWRDAPGRLSDDDYFAGAPDLVVEIAASSASIDLHDKMRVYRRAGVSEYIVWDLQSAEILWFALHDGDYERLPADDAGIIASEVFPGLRLDVNALLSGDLPAVLAALD